MKYVLAKVPTFTSSGSTKIPSCDVPKPISSSAQIIPCDTSPRILESLILKASPAVGYTVVPSTATTTFCPVATLVAPQTICRASPLPTSTVVIFNRSALGCCTQVSTWPINKPSKPPGTD